MSMRNGGSNAERDVSLIITCLCHNRIVLINHATGRMMPEALQYNEDNNQQHHNEDDNHVKEYFTCFVRNDAIRRFHV